MALSLLYCHSRLEMNLFFIVCYFPLSTFTSLWCMQTIHMRILLWFFSSPSSPSFTRLSIDNDSFCFRFEFSIEFDVRESFRFNNNSVQQLAQLNLVGDQTWDRYAGRQDNCIATLTLSPFHMVSSFHALNMRDRLISILVKVKSMCLFYWFHYAPVRDWWDIIGNVSDWIPMSNLVHWWKSFFATL